MTKWAYPTTRADLQREYTKLLDRHSALMERCRKAETTVDELRKVLTKADQRAAEATNAMLSAQAERDVLALKLEALSKL